MGRTSAVSKTKETAMSKANGKTALVIGATGGIGGAVTERLLAEFVRRQALGG